MYFPQPYSCVLPGHQPLLSLSVPVHFTSLAQCRDHVITKLDAPASLIYEIKKQTPLNISILGCQGNNDIHKQIVANNIEHNKPDFMIGLGDSFYDSGVTSKDDPLFKTHFEHFYSKNILQSIPFYSVLGNHDADCQHKIISAWHSFKLFGHAPSQYDRIMAQILRSYEPEPIKKNWSMMSDYYALNTRHANIYFLNSNFLAFDIQQQEWLIDTYKELNQDPISKKWNIVAMHHPLHSPGKRYLDEANHYSDLDQYHLPEFAAQIQAAKHSQHRSMNALLYQLFIKFRKENGLNFELFFGAHDHLLAAMWQRGGLPQSWQMISGAAGAKDHLQAVKIPFTLIHRNITSDDFGNDFYSTVNGHVQLKIINGDQIFIEFRNMNNNIICNKTFTRAAPNSPQIHCKN